LYVAGCAVFYNNAVAYPGILFGGVSTIRQWRTQEFCSGGGVQQIQLRTEDRENGDLGAVAPYSGVLEAAVMWYKKSHFT
jgi:hypothetical protein